MQEIRVLFVKAPWKGNGRSGFHQPQGGLKSPRKKMARLDAHTAHDPVRCLAGPAWIGMEIWKRQPGYMPSNLP